MTIFDLKNIQGQPRKHYKIIKKTCQGTFEFSVLRFECMDPHYVTVLVWGYFEPC